MTTILKTLGLGSRRGWPSWIVLVSHDPAPRPGVRHVTRYGIDAPTIGHAARQVLQRATKEKLRHPVVEQITRVIP
jgi:hypothetical protein